MIESEVRGIEMESFAGEDPVERCIHGAGRVPDRLSRVVRTFCAEVDRLDVPGASLGVQLGTQRYLVHTGVRCEDPKVPPARVDAASDFPIGSLTKSAVALLVLDELDAAGLQLDASIDPDFRASFLQLLQHTAGVPLELDAALMQSGKWRSALNSAPPSYPPGALWNYANTGYAVLGAWLEDRQAPRDPTLAERAATRWPAGEIHFDTTASSVCEHRLIDGELRALPPADPAPNDWQLAAGGARSTAQGLLDLIETLRDEARITRDPRPTGEGDGYGLGVRVRVEDELTLAYHRGATGGAWASMAWASSDRAFVVLANREVELTATTMALRRDLFGLEAEAPRPTAPKLRAFVGEYEVAGWSEPIALRADGDKFRLDLPELGTRGLELTERADGSFRIRWPLHGLPLDLRVLETAEGRWIRSSMFVAFAPASTGSP